MERNELLQEIERRSTTLELGVPIANGDGTFTRYSLLGAVGQKLAAAAENAKEEPVVCPHCGAVNRATEDQGLVYCLECNYIVD
jgi:hypothetical protein